MGSDDLWLSADDVRRRVGNWMASSGAVEVSVQEVAEYEFGILYPNRSVRTQIGFALRFHGWTRIEQRTKVPRYLYRKA